MSNPTWPVYTFQVNLATLQNTSWMQPYNSHPVGNETVSEASNMPATRSSFLCSIFSGNHIVMNNAVQFTAYGATAHYLKKLYVTGSPEDILKVV